MIKHEIDHPCSISLTDAPYIFVDDSVLSAKYLPEPVRSEIKAVKRLGFRHFGCISSIEHDDNLVAHFQVRKDISHVGRVLGRRKE